MTISNVLHVSGLCKNLLLIKCLSYDLNCLLSIDEHGFFAKEKAIGMMHLYGIDVIS